jgi:hypothetical protein
MFTQATCMLRIVRGSGYADRLRDYKIFVNGAQLATLARDAAINLEVPCGPLTIEARLDWGRSEPLMIVATPDEKSKSRSRTIGGLCLLCGAAHSAFAPI